MKITKKQLGFSAIELLITLFIGSAFLISGYQLYAVIINDSTNTGMQARAINASEDYLNRYKTNPPIECTSSTPENGSDISSETGLPNATVTVTITCPYDDTTTVSKISVKVKYGDDNPQKEVNNATYVSP